jgi:hypothetical protein
MLGSEVDWRRQILGMGGVDHLQHRPAAGAPRRSPRQGPASRWVKHQRQPRSCPLGSLLDWTWMPGTPWLAVVDHIPAGKSGVEAGSGCQPVDSRRWAWPGLSDTRHQGCCPGRMSIIEPMARKQPRVHRSACHCAVVAPILEEPATGRCVAAQLARDRRRLHRPCRARPGRAQRGRGLPPVTDHLRPGRRIGR